MRIAVVPTMIIALKTIAIAAPSAEELYDEGQRAFDRQDYATAIAHWQSSYEISNLPLLILNVAQAYRLTGDCVHALSAYQRYIVLDPTSEQRNLADGFVAELSVQCGPKPQAPPVDRFEQPVAKLSPTGHNVKVAGLVVGGVGIATLATGLLFGRRATSLGDQVTRDCATFCDWSIEKAKESDGERYARAGKILDVVGVVALATGLGLYLYGARRDEPSLTIEPRATGATVSWSGRW